jgi:excisionase family DNA binding protein
VVVVVQLDQSEVEQAAGPDVSSEELLTVRELAKFLKLHPKTVYEWVARHAVPCIRLGRRVRFSKSDVSRWLQAQKEGV